MSPVGQPAHLKMLCLFLNWTVVKAIKTSGKRPLKPHPQGIMSGRQLAGEGRLHLDYQIHVCLK